MPVYIITYDLSSEEEPRPIVDRIMEIADESNGAYIKLCDSSYAIDLNLTSKEVYERLKQLVFGSKDHVYVIALSQQWTGWCTESVRKWLNDRLPQPDLRG